MNFVKELNNKMNFSYVIETVAGAAYDMTKEMRIKEYRYNEARLLKEDMKFECENFLYDIKKYPEVVIESKILKHEDIILKRFNKKTIFIEELEVVYYELKEDSNVILYKDIITEEIKVRFNNSFISEKNEICLNEKSDIRKTQVTNFLLKENSCSEICGMDAILESVSLDVKFDNFVLNEYALEYVNRNYEDLKAFKEDCEIAYNEIISEGKIIPIITYVDILSEDVVGIYALNPIEKYKNHYSYELTKVFEV